MKSVPKSAKQSRAAQQNIAYQYGHRWVELRDQRGRKIWAQQALTLQDVLHPQLGDMIAASDAHYLECNYLYSVLRAWLADQPGVVVLGGCRIHWDVAKLQNHCPDIAVIRGAGQVDCFVPFDVATEGVRPELIIEVTSPNSRKLDLVTKRRQYHQAGVPWYAIVDERCAKGQRQLRLLGYRRGARSYQPLPLNGKGRLHLQAVDLWLGQEHGRVALYKPSGERLGDYMEVDRAWKAEVQARQAAEARAVEAESKLKALRAELRRLRNQQ
jgi:colicin import membrane protein